MYLSWERLLESDIVGCDYEKVIDNNVIYRGPIAKVEASGPYYHFTFIWLAVFDTTVGVWEKSNDPGYFVETNIPPQLTDGNRIRIHQSEHTVTTIFPTGKNLDPSKVLGLDPKFLKK